MSTTKPYTLAGYAADRAHGDLDQDAMRATVEALDAAQKRIAELEEQLGNLRSQQPVLLNDGLAFKQRADAAEAELTEVRRVLDRYYVSRRDFGESISQFSYRRAKRIIAWSRFEKALEEQESALAERNFARGDQEAAEHALATVTMERDEARADFAAVVSELECEPTREDAVAEILRRERLYDEARASEARMREALERFTRWLSIHRPSLSISKDGSVNALAAWDDLEVAHNEGCAALSTPASDWLAARDRRVAEMQRADDIANLTKFRGGFEEGMETGYMTMPKHAARDMLLTLEGLFETEPLVTFKPEGET